MGCLADCCVSLCASIVVAARCHQHVSHGASCFSNCFAAALECAIERAALLFSSARLELLLCAYCILMPVLLCCSVTSTRFSESKERFPEHNRVGWVGGYSTKVESRMRNPVSCRLTDFVHVGCSWTRTYM